MRLVIVNTHPIQYFAPMYRLLSPKIGGGLAVVYCSRKGLDESLDEGYGQRFKWGVNLLEGYEHVFLREAEENKDKPAEAIRCGTLPKVLDELAPEYIQVQGYSGPAATTTLKWTRRSRVKILMRGDTWSGAGEASGWLRGQIKRLWFKRTMTPRCAGFLAVGKRNHDYWKEMGAPDSRIANVPYGVDKSCFRPARNNGERQAARVRYGLSGERNVLGFVGRFAHKKGVAQLMEYMARQDQQGRERPTLLIAGDGPLRSSIEKSLSTMKWPAVFTGFTNQDELPDVYRACDAIFVPSLEGETWGFVVQEALACGVPVIASTTVGCVPDLLRAGDNGWILPSGEWSAWSSFLHGFSEMAGDWSPERAARISSSVPGMQESAQAFAEALELF